MSDKPNYFDGYSLNVLNEMLKIQAVVTGNAYTAVKAARKLYDDFPNRETYQAWRAADDHAVDAYLLGADMRAARDRVQNPEQHRRIFPELYINGKKGI